MDTSESSVGEFMSLKGIFKNCVPVLVYQLLVASGAGGGGDQIEVAFIQEVLPHQ